MARGRFISRSLGSSERFYTLHHAGDYPQRTALAQLATLGLTEFAGELYALLITVTDDFGRFHGDAFTVKMQVFPVSPRRVDEFDAALAGLADARLIHRYRYNGDGKLALQIVDFDEHQQGLQKRTRSKFPPPDGDPPDEDDGGTGGNGASADSSASSEVHGNSENFREVSDFPADSRKVSPEGEVEVEVEAEVEDQPHRRVGKKTAASGRRKPPTDERRRRAQQLVELWRSTCPRLTGVVALTEKRITAACAALDRVPVLEQWRSYFEKLNASTFCGGSNDRGWRADFDFALKPDSMTKTFEGKYDDRAPAAAKPRVIRNADDARAAVRERGIERVTEDADIDLR